MIIGGRQGCAIQASDSSVCLSADRSPSDLAVIWASSRHSPPTATGKPPFRVSRNTVGVCPDESGLGEQISQLRGEALDALAFDAALGVLESSEHSHLPVGRDERTVSLGESDDLIAELGLRVDREGDATALVRGGHGEDLVAELVGDERSAEDVLGGDHDAVTHGVLPELDDRAVHHVLLLVTRFGQTVLVDLLVGQGLLQEAILSDLPGLGGGRVAEEAQARPVVGRVGLALGVSHFDGLLRDLEADRGHHLERVACLTVVVVEDEQRGLGVLATDIDPDLAVGCLPSWATLQLELRTSAAECLEGEDVVKVVSEMREERTVVIVDGCDDGRNGQILAVHDFLLENSVGLVTDLCFYQSLHWRVSTLYTTHV